LGKRGFFELITLHKLILIKLRIEEKGFLSFTKPD